MASIQKKPGGEFAVRWWETEGGKRRQRQRSCPDRKTANALKLEIERASARGEKWEPVTAREETELRDIAEAFILWSKTEHAALTTNRYARLLEQFLKWGHGPVTKLSVSLLTEYRAWLSSTRSTRNKQRGSATIRKCLQAVLLCWEWASDNAGERGWVIPTPPRAYKLPKAPRPVLVAPTWAQMDRCIEATTTEWHRRAAVLMRYTGVRISEALNLRWEDFDLPGKKAYIPGEITKGGTGGRLIPICPPLIEELALWDREGEYLVPAPEKERLAADGLYRGKVNTYLKRAWARTGIEERIWHGKPCHCFRAGFVSGLKHARADIEAVEWLVGHQRGDPRSHYLDPAAFWEVAVEAVGMVPEIKGEL